MVYVRLISDSYRDLIGKGSFPFKPGMSATADIQTRRQVNVLSVPINAVTTREKADAEVHEKKSDDKENTPAPSMEDLEVVVFSVGNDNRVKKMNVSTGIQDINYIEIISGLNDSIRVVTGPYDVVSKTLKDSMEVKVVDKKELFEKN